MDEEIFELAKEKDLSIDEVEDIVAFAEVSDLDIDEAFEVWENS